MNSQQLLSRKSPNATIPKSDQEVLHDAARSNASIEVIVEIVERACSYKKSLAMAMCEEFDSIDSHAEITNEHLYMRICKQQSDLSQASVMGKWLANDGCSARMVLEELKKSVKNAVEVVGPPSLDHIVDDAVELEALGDIEGALDRIFDEMDHMFKLGRFGEVDRFLASVKPKEYSIELLIGILTATLIADNKLSKRFVLFDSVRRHLESIGEDVAGLLFGLEKLSG